MSDPADYTHKPIAFSEEGTFDRDVLTDFDHVVVKKGARAPMLAYGNTMVIADKGSVIRAPEWLRVIEINPNSPVPKFDNAWVPRT